MTVRYTGPATLRMDDGHSFETVVHLATTVDDVGISSWEGSATTSDLGALRVAGRGGVLVLPDGREGEVHVATVELNGDMAGVLVRLHGAGDPPYT